MEVVEGELPEWLAGNYVRNGPGRFEAGERRLEHWFDGYGLLLKVSLATGRAPMLSTRFVASEAHEAAAAGTLRYPEFMTPLFRPGNGVIAALKSLVGLAAGDPTDNACVNVINRRGSSGGDGGSVATVECMTETQRSWFEIDMHSLDTVRRVPWDGDRVGQLSTAHAQRDPAGGGWLNVGTEIAPPFGSQYRVFRLADESPQTREVLASVPCLDRASPCWLHDFGCTTRCLVLIEQPAFYSVTAMIGLEPASHGSIEWQPQHGTRVHVIDRASGARVTHTLSPPFFFFHIANAFDGADGGVSLDLCAFDDPDILTALRLDRLTDDELARDLPSSRLVRLSVPPSAMPGAAARGDLSSDGADRIGGGGGDGRGRSAPTLMPLDCEEVTGGFSDLPTIAPCARGVPSYRFVYGIAASRPTAVSNRLVKTDVSGRGGDAAFEVAGMLPGEPLYVARPGGEAEDDGAVLSMGTDPDGGTSLYVLDARTMELLARCRAPLPLPAGFHAEWVPSPSPS